MFFENLMPCFASPEALRQRYAERLEAEELRLARETLALADAGDCGRLIDALDYRENYSLAVRALVACANQGNVEAKDAVAALARTWAELHAEVE